ncbi:MAG: rRNA maturation RNase YbeY [Gammaproteobacteria bacterium]|nr:rRNA maturation RNase YbeY [Gammaproteobacteria bacterium]
MAAAPAPDAGALCRWAAAALETDDRAVCMRVVNEAEGAALNARFRGGSGPTNVLSFPAGEAGLLGDIAICAPVVEAEARAQRKTVEAHFAHMVVHGVFHLRGMDHGDDVGAARMEARESAVLHTLGFADPYAATQAK